MPIPSLLYKPGHVTVVNNIYRSWPVLLFFFRTSFHRMRSPGRGTGEGPTIVFGRAFYDVSFKRCLVKAVLYGFTRAYT